MRAKNPSSLNRGRACPCAANNSAHSPTHERLTEPNPVCYTSSKGAYCNAAYPIVAPTHGGNTLGLCNPTRRRRPRRPAKALPDNYAALRHTARTAQSALLPHQGRADPPRQAAQPAPHPPPPQPLTAPLRSSIECLISAALCHLPQGGLHYQLVPSPSTGEG